MTARFGADGFAEVGMGFEVKLKGRIVVNGKEYASTEEMPAELRQAFERAMSSRDPVPDVAGSARITVNGQTYDSIDEMPPEVRELYRAAVRFAAEQRAGEQPGPLAGGEPTPRVGEDPAATSRPIGPTGGSPRARLALLLVAGLLVLAWLLVQLLR